MDDLMPNFLSRASSPSHDSDDDDRIKGAFSAFGTDPSNQKAFDDLSTMSETAATEATIPSEFRLDDSMSLLEELSVARDAEAIARELMMEDQGEPHEGEDDTTWSSSTATVDPRMPDKEGMLTGQRSTEEDAEIVATGKNDDKQSEPQKTSKHGSIALQEDGQVFWHVEKILARREVKKNTRKPGQRPTYVYRLKWQDWPHVDKTWYPEDNLTEYMVDQYEQQIAQRGASKKKGSSATTMQRSTPTKKQSTPKRRKRTKQHTHANKGTKFGDSHVNDESSGGANSDDEYCDRSAPRRHSYRTRNRKAPSASKRKTRSERENAQEEQPEYSGKRAPVAMQETMAKPVAAESTGPRLLPRGQGGSANARATPDRDTQRRFDYRLSSQVVEQILLRTSRCPACAKTFVANVESKHCPYMSQGCGHSICFSCLFKLKTETERRREDYEWWPCPVPICNTENAFLASKPPSVNSALMANIAAIEQLLSGRKHET